MGKNCLYVLIVPLFFGLVIACQHEKTVAEETPPLPPDLPPPVISGNLPLAVPPSPQDDTPEQARPFFDYFSWQSFIALNWPVSSTRGEPKDPDDPNVFTSAPNGTPTVWGTYREAFDLFGQGENRPPAWSSDQTGATPCDPAGKKLLLMANKGGTLLDGVNEAFSFPLIDQHLNYAYTEVRFNQAQYDFVRGSDSEEGTWLYRIVNLAATPIYVIISPDHSMVL